MPAPIYLVSCVKCKLPAPAPARLLYTSDWFKKARAYVEALGSPWYVLSAQYGLVRPQEEIAPYELTLASLSREERERWGRLVLEKLYSLEGRKGAGREVRLLAGVRYREPLLWDLEVAGYRPIAPLSGMGIGHQKQWLSQNTPPLGGR